MSDEMTLDTRDFNIKDKNGATISDTQLKESLSKYTYTNETLYKKFSELYGDVLSNKGLNVADPVKAKMLYYDKYHLYGDVDPNTTLKSYVFFTRPELHFSAENILNSPILEFYYNTEIGRIVMAMLADPEDTIGVYTANLPKYNVLVEHLNKIESLSKALKKIEDHIETNYLDPYQTQRLETAGVKIEKTLQSKMADPISQMENILKEAEKKDSETDIESSLSSIEESVASVTDDLINSAWSSGKVVATYDYYMDTVDVPDESDTIRNDDNAGMTAIKNFGLKGNSIQSGVNSILGIKSIETKSSVDSKNSTNKTYLEIVSERLESNLNDENRKYATAESRIQVLKDYINCVQNLTFESSDMMLDGSIDFNVLDKVKNSFTVKNTYTGENVKANYTTPFIPLLSNACISLDGLKDFNLESFTYDSDYHGGSIQIATGQDDVYGPGDINVEFEDIYGGPLSIMILIWVEYIAKVSRGYLNPTRENLLNHVLDYTCSIYVFNCDRDGSTIRYFAKLTGCFPISFPLSSLIRFTREPTLENAKNISITFRYNRYEPMNPEIMADFNFLSMQEFALKPEADYENCFGNASFFKQYSQSRSSTVTGRSSLSNTANSIGAMSWTSIPIDQGGLSGTVPFPSVPGSELPNGFRTSDMPNDYWGGYPYIKDLSKLIWVYPKTNPDDEKYRKLFYSDSE